MKRSLILLGAVTATLASCSKSEVVDVNDSQAIGFETFVNKSTRAVTNDEGSVTNKLLDFYVYGGSNESQNLFAGDKVYRSSASDPWKYDNTKYWFKNRTYKFAAISPGAGANLSANFGYSDGHMELTATVDNATANQYDLVYGEATKTTSEDLSSVSTVAFNLGHILSKIRILFEKNNNFGKETQLVITNLTLAGANTSTGSGIFSKGVYKYNNGWTWTKAAEGSADVTFSTSTSYTVTDKSITGETSVEEVGQTFYVIPQTPDSGVKLSFTVQLQEHNGTDWENVGSAQTLTKTIATAQATWNSNNIYTYKVKLSETTLPGDDRYAIDFSATVDSWGTDNTPVDVDFAN